VRWADGVNAEADRAQEFEAILGYHLEQAYRYLGDLGPHDAEGVAIGRDAARRLASAGRRAFARGDLRAATNLLRRALGLVPADDADRPNRMQDLGEVLISMGAFAEARSILEQCVSLASGMADARAGAGSRLLLVFLKHFTGESADWIEEARETAQALIPVLESVDAYNELAHAWRLILTSHGKAGRYDQASEAAERTVHFARLAGNERVMARAAGALANVALLGRTAVPHAIAQCEQLLAERIGDREVECGVKCRLARLKAMNGELTQARALYREARSLLRDLGRGVMSAAAGLDVAVVEMHGGDLALAESEIEADVADLKARGEKFHLSTLVAFLAQIVRDQGRDAEALELLQSAEQASAPDDVDSQVRWRSIKAPILARAGDGAQGETMARLAVKLATHFEAPMLLADASYELARVLAIVGKPEAARDEMTRARDLYGAKGNLVSLRRCEAWLASP
jgi:tetratricopeptide (TPR) repeat protein